MTKLWLIWKDPKERKRYKVGVLEKGSDCYTFKYVNPELNIAKEAGFDYYPGFEDTNKIYKNKELFFNIENRLPNKKRPDYLDILNAYNLDFDSDSMAILKATKGRLITDTYEFVEPFDTKKISFDIAGTRHCKDIEKCKNDIVVNDKLSLELNPDNISDPFAIKVILEKNGEKYHIGFVPRYYSKELTKLLNSGTEYSALVQSLNFDSIYNDEDVSAYVKLIFKD